LLFGEPDRPCGGSPGAHQDRPLCLLERVVEQDAAQALAPVRGANVGMADQVHVLDRLDTHNTDQDIIGFTPERPDALAELVRQRVPSNGWVE
jgi:hypothetical protein